MAEYLLALDQGTTSTRAIIYRANGLVPLATVRRELTQHYPASGWVEHDPEQIWADAVAVMRAAVAQVGASAGEIGGIGITNQRETTVIWERSSGKPIYPAIVWQDRRTAAACDALLDHKTLLSQRTGLVLDPYFCATKIGWLLDHVPGARERAERGELAFGTIDSFLLWRLTGGAVHATDATNASRTLLFDIHRGCWDDDLLALFRVPRALLPDVRDCTGIFGSTDVLGGKVEIAGVAGDQQAATIGQACFAPGMVKATYGTGCFILLNTGAHAVASQHEMLTTIAYRLGGVTTYALEGAIFIAGAAVQWLRDGLKVIGQASEAGPLAAQADPEQAVYLVPAFTGLGAPYWDPAARGALFGLTRATGPAELSRAALESVAYQTRDLLHAMAADAPDMTRPVLRVDGGMVASDWAMQFLSDMLAAPVDRPAVLETTALGAAYLAGLAQGLCPAPDSFARSWHAERRFTPAMPEAERRQRYDGWCDAVRRTLSSRVTAG